MALSKRQSARLGTLLAVMFRDEVPAAFAASAIQDGFVYRQNGELLLTAKGLDEKNRLCTLAGLNIRYLSEVPAHDPRNSEHRQHSEHGDQSP